MVGKERVQKKADIRKGRFQISKKVYKKLNLSTSHLFAIIIYSLIEQDE